MPRSPYNNKKEYPEDALIDQLAPAAAPELADKDHVKELAQKQLLSSQKNSRQPRNGFGRGLAKKGGAGGKGVWGKLGDELDLENGNFSDELEEDGLNVEDGLEVETVADLNQEKPESANVINDGGLTDIPPK